MFEPGSKIAREKCHEKSPLIFEKLFIKKVDDGKGDGDIDNNVVGVI